eukprot:1138770-Pelagomonas_calceolata.AAC.14
MLTYVISRAGSPRQAYKRVATHGDDLLRDQHPLEKKINRIVKILASRDLNHLEDDSRHFAVTQTDAQPA